MKMLESEAFLLYHFSGEPGHIIILFWIPNLNFPFIFLEGEGGSLASYFSFYALVFTCIKEKKYCSILFSRSSDKLKTI